MAPEALRPDVRSGRRRLSLAWIATVPFFAYTFLFLFLPAGNVLLGAFKGVHGGYTFANIRLLFHHPYIDAYKTSIEVSVVTALLGGFVGLAIAYAALREGTPRWVRSGSDDVLRRRGELRRHPARLRLHRDARADRGRHGVPEEPAAHRPLRHNFTLFSKTGVEIVYLYFQLPLMILVISPAIDGLRREWREAASNLGASSWQFWRYVGLPVLMPSILGAIILLFGNAFAAYATAYSLTSGTVNLVPILIGAYYTGNVLDNPHLAQALAFGMFVVLAVMMMAYIPLQRRAARWAK